MPSLGFVADALAATILNLGMDRQREERTLRAFNKLLWLQNDLINRHYDGAGNRELAEADFATKCGNGTT
jgi:hypothetical protein